MMFQVRTANQERKTGRSTYRPPRFELWSHSDL